jgi:hypothetical protein
MKARTWLSGAHETVHGLTVLEGEDRWNRPHAKLRRNVRIFVGIHFDEAHRPARLLHELLKDGVCCLQGPHQGAQKSTITGTLRDAQMARRARHGHPCVTRIYACEECV